MTIAEKITKLDESADKLIELNNDFEETLYGTSYGGKSYYDEFWDGNQKNGKRTDYAYSYSGFGWNNITFCPKYDITVTGGYGVFYYCQYKGSFKELLNRQGITLTFPDVYNISNQFMYCEFTELGELDYSTARQAAPNGVFNNASKLHTIDKIILSNVVDFTFINWFQSCSALENITFEGEIRNSISFEWSTKLTKDSITNIINHLSDTVSGKTLTLSITAVKNAFNGGTWDSDGDGKDDTIMASEEWVDLQDTIPNWTITLV